MTYTWGSSSGRLADLDDVQLGEYVWYNWWGYYANPLGSATQYPNPPFSYAQINGQYWPLIPIDATLGTLIDEHGVGVTVNARYGKGITAKQYYWYKINDGLYVPSTSVVDVGVLVQETTNLGDETSEVKFKWNAVTYSVVNDAGVWKYIVDKGVDGHAEVDLTGKNLPWTPQ